jgi:hypothetical protein
LLIDLEEDKTLKAVIVGLLREIERARGQPDVIPGYRVGTLPMP